MGIDETTPKLELEDIQSIVLRRRPSPYCGCHVLLKIEDPSQGRELLNKLRPYVLSAAGYGGQDTWMALVITYAGLVALEVPESSLASFPAAFRDGMAARSSIVATQAKVRRNAGTCHTALATSVSQSHSSPQPATSSKPTSKKLAPYWLCCPV
jgi:hypothetical protein